MSYIFIKDHKTGKSHKALDFGGPNVVNIDGHTCWTNELDSDTEVRFTNETISLYPSGKYIPIMKRPFWEVISEVNKGKKTYRVSLRHNTTLEEVDNVLPFNLDGDVYVVEGVKVIASPGGISITTHSNSNIFYSLNGTNDIIKGNIWYIEQAYNTLLKSSISVDVLNNVTNITHFGVVPFTFTDNSELLNIQVGDDGNVTGNLNILLRRPPPTQFYSMAVNTLFMEYNNGWQVKIKGTSNVIASTPDFSNYSVTQNVRWEPATQSISIEYDNNITQNIPIHGDNILAKGIYKALGTRVEVYQSANTLSSDVTIDSIFVWLNKLATSNIINHSDISVKTNWEINKKLYIPSRKTLLLNILDIVDSNGSATVAYIQFLTGRGIIFYDLFNTTTAIPNELFEIITNLINLQVQAKMSVTYVNS